jgi:hypothetical protein
MTPTTAVMRFQNEPDRPRRTPPLFCRVAAWASAYLDASAGSVHFTSIPDSHGSYVRHRPPGRLVVSISQKQLAPAAPLAPVLLPGICRQSDDCVDTAH